MYFPDKIYIQQHACMCILFIHRPASLGRAGPARLISRQTAPDCRGVNISADPTSRVAAPHSNSASFSQNKLTECV